MVRKVLIFSLVGMMCYVSSFAQNEVDALRYSQLGFYGTARFSSMAGAFGALGGDFSTLSFNPAGIAIYRSSEFTFTPSIFSQTTTSDYNNSSLRASKINFNFNNVGFVGTYMNPDYKAKDSIPGWVNLNFGFGYNRTNSFHNRINIQGDNTTSSLLDVFVQNANGNAPSALDPFSDSLAFWLVLIDTVPGSNPYSYFSAIPHGVTITQQKDIETSGSMGETMLSFGGNYSNRLYLGMSLGIPDVKYSEQSTYKETDKNDSVPGFQSYTYNSHLTTTGAGFVFKFGMIYRATDWLRIGGAIHSPTFFSLTDSYSNNMSVIYNSGTYNVSSPQGSYDYKLTTPMRAIGSLAFIIKKRGLVSADYEYVDYSTAELHASSDAFFNANNAISQKYTSTGNIRVGTEWRLDPFSLRAGFAYYGSPYAKDVNNDGSRMCYSAGFGIHQNDYFLDFGYVLTQSTDNYYLYDPSLVNPSKDKMNSSSFTITLGFKY